MLPTNLEWGKAYLLAYYYIYTSTTSYIVGHSQDKRLGTSLVYLALKLMAIFSIDLSPLRNLSFKSDCPHATLVNSLDVDSVCSHQIFYFNLYFPIKFIFFSDLFHFPMLSSILQLFLG